MPEGENIALNERALAEQNQPSTGSADRTHQAIEIFSADENPGRTSAELQQPLSASVDLADRPTPAFRNERHRNSAASPVDQGVKLPYGMHNMSNSGTP